MQLATSNNLLFHGRYYDPETGYYYFRHRYYSPTLGRFLSRDPVNYVDGMNLYRSFNNNALRWMDPMGLYTDDELQSEIDSVNTVIDTMYEGYLNEGVPPRDLGLESAGSPYEGSTNPMKNEFENMLGQTAQSIYEHITSQIANLIDPDGNFWNYWYQAEIDRHKRYLKWLEEQLEKIKKSQSCP